MINKSFDAVDKADIEALVTNQVPESRTLEYKEMLPGGSDGERKEFFADISAFANAAGGDILYGVAEKRDANNRTTGLPESANGLSITNSDTEIRRLDSMILNGIEPRIAGVRIRAIEGFNAGPVIMARVPKSWASPHMVAVNESRFYSRNNAGKYPLDVTEIRSAFALSDSLSERVRRFRDERVSRIVADETPIALSGTARIILHILPLISLDPTFQIDLREMGETFRLSPIGVSAWDSHYNFDGFLTFSRQPDGASCSYVQVFRNGAIEAVECYLLVQRTSTGIGLIPNTTLEQRVAEAIKNYLHQENVWGVESPYFVMLSLVGIKNYVIATDAFSFSGLHPIERDVLMLPDVLVDENDRDIATFMRPTFDALWQASGLSRSFNYDEEGNWKSRNR